MSRAHVDEGEGVTRVLVVEPSRIVRRGIREELAADHSLAVAEAASGAEALAAVSEHPDVVLVDLDLPDRPGHEVCGAILELLPSTAVVVLAAEGGEASVRSAIDAGARGYLLKDAVDLDLPDAIRRVLAGETVIDPRAAASLIDSARWDAGQPKLSAQELNVLRLVAEGLTNPEIGSRLFLSRHTVKEYVSHAMHKLEATNRIEAVRKATSLGLIEGVVAQAPTPHAPETRTLVYNESGDPIQSTELKVTPLKLDRLQIERRP